MGDSLPPPASFDLVGSYARRRGVDVEIVLSEPKTEISDAPVVTLVKARQSIDAPGRLEDGPHGRRLVVRAPRKRLSDGTWSLALRSGSGTPERLDARLLVQDARPLVLLWGVKGNASILPRSRRNNAKHRVAAAGGRALDGALSVLPDSQAKKLRTQARSVARRLIG